ncbi:MAG TPA: hypothetical protein PKU69_02360 [Bacillota bacterium]|nr:hypothetical protein [Bacillota bacterium]
MWPYIIAIGITIVIVGLYVWSYSVNQKTEKPEDCEDIECSSCKSADCSHRH